MSVLLGNGDGTFQPQQSYPFSIATSRFSLPVAVADLNGDGKPDLVVANPEQHGERPAGQRRRHLPAPADLPVGHYPVAVAVADLNGDGKPDIVVANAVSNTVSVLLGNGDGTFTPATPASGVGRGTRRTWPTSTATDAPTASSSTARQHPLPQRSAGATMRSPHP